MRCRRLLLYQNIDMTYIHPPRSKLAPSYLVHNARLSQTNVGKAFSPTVQIAHPVGPSIPASNSSLLGLWAQHNNLPRVSVKLDSSLGSNGWTDCCVNALAIDVFLSWCSSSMHCGLDGEQSWNPFHPVYVRTGGQAGQFFLIYLFLNDDDNSSCI